MDSLGFRIPKRNLKFNPKIPTSPPVGEGKYYWFSTEKQLWYVAIVQHETKDKLLLRTEQNDHKSFWVKRTDDKLRKQKPDGPFAVMSSEVSKLMASKPLTIRGRRAELIIDAELEPIGFKQRVFYRVEQATDVEISTRKLKQEEDLKRIDFLKNQRCVDLILNDTCRQSFDVDWQPLGKRIDTGTVDIVTFDRVQLSSNSTITTRFRLKSDTLDAIRDGLKSFPESITWCIMTFIAHIDIDSVHSFIWVKTSDAHCN